MEKEKSIRVSESTYRIVKDEAKKRLQSIKTIVKIAIEQLIGRRK